MANLFKADGGSLIAFMGLLHRLGVTAEVVAECLKDLDVAKRRVSAFMSPECPSGFVDCLKAPHIPEGLSCIHDHDRNAGKLEILPAMLGFYQHDKQMAGKSVPAGEIQKALGRGQYPMNACLLEYLLQNVSLIPLSWRGKRVFFWRTTYVGPGRSYYVRYIHFVESRWQGGESVPSNRWEEGYTEIAGDFLSTDVAAVFVVQPRR